MGGASSKAARSAASASTRKYPTRIPTSTTTNAPPPQAQPQPQGPTVHPSLSSKPVASTRTQAVDLDARDPDFAASLRSLGPVTPNPTLSNSSSFNQSPNSRSSQTSTASGAQFPIPATNPALVVVQARERIQREAEQELEEVGRSGKGYKKGRLFLDAATLRQAVSMRGAGMEDGKIERELRLREGSVGKLGVKGVVGEVRGEETGFQG